MPLRAEDTIQAFDVRRGALARGAIGTIGQAKAAFPAGADSVDSFQDNRLTEVAGQPNLMADWKLLSVMSRYASHVHPQESPLMHGRGTGTVGQDYAIGQRKWQPSTPKLPTSRHLASKVITTLANGAAARIMRVGIDWGGEQMAEQYELRKFLRELANKNLKDYFASIEWDPKVRWNELSESGEERITPLFEAIRGAPDDMHARINKDFQQVNDLATEGGIRTLINEGRFRGLDLGKDLENVGGLHDKALRALVDHPAGENRFSIFEVAVSFQRADNLPGRSWRIRSGVPEVEHAKTPDDAVAKSLEQSKIRLKDALSSYYRMREGRGQRCTIDHFERDDRLYWFAYLQDYEEARMEYVEDELKRRTARPVFEVVFVHSNAERSLNIYVKGDSKTVEELRTIWARAILDTDDLGTPPDRGIEYELNTLKTRREFPYRPEHGIRVVRVSSLRLSFIGDRQNRRITLEANTRKDHNAVFGLLEDLLKDGKLSLDIVNVTQATINFVFAADTRRGTKTVTARISHPNSCSLKYEPKEEIARKYLREWKIDVSQSAQSNPPGA